MTIRLYDSLSRRIDAVTPAVPGRMTLYSCGPTVYDRIHVGNARPFVVAMTLRRHLLTRGIDVTLAINITDVNDKIYVAARAHGVPSDRFAAEMTQAYIDDTSRLGLGRPDVEPSVTGSIDAIIGLISRLVAAGVAYPAAGDVYYRVAAFDGYGALSRQRPADMLAEGRVESGEGKQSPLDFALWKAQKPDEDTAWDSPWGRGRPGWHIECSAMAIKHLGEEIDVHGGGLDLIFPHHENERAQSEAATHHRFVRTWLHNGMLRFGGGKMSKSTGNVERLGEAIDRHGAETLLCLFAQAHYRSPLDYTDDTLAQAREACNRLRDAIRTLRRVPAAASGAGDDELHAATTSTAQRVADALDDDFHTPQALATLFELVSTAHRLAASGAVSAGQATATADTLRRALDVLGLAGLDAVIDVPDDVRQLARDREAARAERDYARADALRDVIAMRGYGVRDTPEGAEIVPL
jgi:cysteinyl-tRNA synthetase